MIGTTVVVRRRSWTVIGGALTLAAIAWPTVACHRRNPISPASKSQPRPDAGRTIDPGFLVLVWTETTPPAARMVRVSDGHVIGYTPEIVEFHQSAEPVAIRFELEGYLPVTREVSALSDGELKVVLEPIPKTDLPATKRSKGSKGH